MQGNWQNPNQPQQGYPQQQPQAPQAAPYQAPAAPGGGMPQPEKGLFAAMFDFSFNSYVTLTVLKVVYVLVVIGCVLAGLGAMYGAIDSGSYIMVPAIPIAVVLYILVFRMQLELFVLLFKFLQRKASGS